MVRVYDRKRPWAVAKGARAVMGCWDEAVAVKGRVQRHGARWRWEWLEIGPSALQRVVREPDRARRQGAGHRGRRRLARCFAAATGKRPGEKVATTGWLYRHWPRRAVDWRSRRGRLGKKEARDARAAGDARDAVWGGSQRGRMKCRCCKGEATGQREGVCVCVK